MSKSLFKQIRTQVLENWRDRVNVYWQKEIAKLNPIPDGGWKTANRRLLVNKAQCLLCQDIIESKSRWDFQMCSCGNLHVDGGLDYVKRGFKKNEWEDLSEYEEVE